MKTFYDGKVESIAVNGEAGIFTKDRGKVTCSMQAERGLAPREQKNKQYQAMLDAEIYLNSEVAAEIYRKFGLLIRVHL